MSQPLARPRADATEQGEQCRHQQGTYDEHVEHDAHEHHERELAEGNEGNDGQQAEARRQGEPRSEGLRRLCPA